MTHQVRFTWARRPSQPTAEAVRQVILGVLRHQRHPDSEVHLLLTDDEQLRTLNHTYRSIDRATDVLSFPDGDLLPTGHLLLGEIIISLETARRQAGEMGHSELRELQELALHGTIHLLGFDHEQDQGAMDSLEMLLRQELLP